MYQGFRTNECHFNITQVKFRHMSSNKILEVLGIGQVIFAARVLSVLYRHWEGNGTTATRSLQNCSESVKDFHIASLMLIPASSSSTFYKILYGRPKFETRGEEYRT